MFCQGFVKEWLMEKSFQLIIALTHYREIHPPPLRHKKTACRLSEEKPTGRICSEKSFIINGWNTRNTKKNYYIINFVNENKVYKKCVSYTER